jgi:prepilin-type N-terminal cleavage/methylation domain-containing protein
MIKGQQTGLTMHVSLGKNGVTLVEMMVALVVLLLVSLALMQTALVSIDANMNNVLRDEAVSIAEQRMNEARSIPFLTLTSDALPLTGGECPGTFATGVTIERGFRNIINKEFCTNRTVDPLGAEGDARQVDIRVRWTWKGEVFNHRIMTLIRRPD